MKILKEVLLSKNGMIASAMVVGGILVSALAGKLLSIFAVADAVIIIGSIFALIGTQQISQLIVMSREYHENEEDQ